MTTFEILHIETFEDYIYYISEYLYENTTEEWRKIFPFIFNYTMEDINNNLEYFKDCYKRELSAYNALSLFEKL